jgi:5-methylcytosine-specific restriction protein A
MHLIYLPFRDLQQKTCGRTDILRKPRKDNQPHQIIDGYHLTRLRPEECRLSQLLEELLAMPWKAPRHRPVNHRKEPRPTAHQRGYDRQHRKMREQELAEQPLCVYCLAQGLIVAAEEIDHVVPVSRGGATHDPENRVPACRACNQAKKAKLTHRPSVASAAAAAATTPPGGGIDLAG